jgi:hypothetical protein
MSGEERRCKGLSHTWTFYISSEGEMMAGIDAHLCSIGILKKVSCIDRIGDQKKKKLKKSQVSSRKGRVKVKSSGPLFIIPFQCHHYQLQRLL